MNKKVSFFDIVKSMESRRVLSSMATTATWILTMIVWSNLKLIYLKYLASLFVWLGMIIFVVFFVFFLIRIIKYKSLLKKEISHPVSSNFLAWIFISSAVLVAWIWNVLNPLNMCIYPEITTKIFYIIALIVGSIVVILVPFMLTISENVDPKHAVWIWFLPPVGIFVLVFAWNFMTLHNIWWNWIPYLNIFYIWMAFMVYLLVNSMIYSRLKFYPLPAPEIAPSFVIWLAPVWVSIIAINTFYSVIEKTNVFNFDLNTIKTLTSLFSAMLAWYWLRWFIWTILILWFYFIKKSIPYSLSWWAFVFPLAAFWIWLNFVNLNLNCAFICSLTFIIWIITVFLWFFVFYKTIKDIVTLNAFNK